MTDEEVAQLLIKNGWFGEEELKTMTLAQILVKRGIIGAEELNQGLSIYEVLKKRGLI